MKMINVVGTSASGKTTFSKKLAEKLNLEYIELDDLFWMDDWQETEDVNFFHKIQHRIDLANQDITKQGYVIDGNYSRSLHIKWQEIDTVIWLDVPFHINLFQSAYRAINRIISNKQLWKSSNNRESFRQLLSRDSIILWMMKTHQKNRKKYLAMMADPLYSHIQFIHLKSRKDSSMFLEKL